MNYVGLVNIPLIGAEHLAKILVPVGGLKAGQVVYCEDLAVMVGENVEVYYATQPTTTNLSSKKLAVVLNGGFETLIDGRRPTGQPDFTQYEFKEGEIAVVAFCDSHLLLSIGYDSIDENSVSSISVGKFLIPQNNSNYLKVVSTVPDEVHCALKILAIRSMALGERFGLDYTTTYVCVPTLSKTTVSNVFEQYVVKNSSPNAPDEGYMVNNGANDVEPYMVRMINI